MYPGKSSKDALDVIIVLQQFSFECSFVQTNQKNLILTYLNRRSNFPVLTNAMTNQVRVRYVQVGAFVRRCALSKTVHRSYFDGKSCPLGSQLCYAACSLARLVSPLFAPVIVCSSLLLAKVEQGALMSPCAGAHIAAPMQVGTRGYPIRIGLYLS